MLRLGLSRKAMPKPERPRNGGLHNCARSNAISLSIDSLRSAGPRGITVHKYIVAVVCLCLGRITCYKGAVWARCPVRGHRPIARRSAVRAACRSTGESPVLVSQWNWNRKCCAGFPHQKHICGECSGHRGGGRLQVNLGAVRGRRSSIRVSRIQASDGRGDRLSRCCVAAYQLYERVKAPRVICEPRWGVEIYADVGIIRLARACETSYPSGIVHPRPPGPCSSLGIDASIEIGDGDGWREGREAHCSTCWPVHVERRCHCAAALFFRYLKERRCSTVRISRFGAGVRIDPIGG